VRSWLSLRAAVGTAFRAPTPTELAADFTAPLGGQIIGNPDLRPERAIGYESGFLFARARLWADVVFFRNDIRDRITTVAL
ncbi:TonB-dependent receptor, partial [Acinetobacter baumannii]